MVVGGIVGWQAEEEEEVEESDVAEEEEEGEEEGEESDVAEEGGEDVSNIELNISNPNTKHIGEGIQTKQTKKNVEIILNELIPSKMKELTGNNLKDMEYRCCKCLEDMSMEGLHKQCGKFDHHYEMAYKCGYEFMRDQYYKVIENKHPEYEVVGGSTLTEFVKSFLHH